MSIELAPRSGFGTETYPESLDLEGLNVEFADLTLRQRIERSRDIFGDSLVLATTFGPTASVLLKEATDVYPDIPVINIRHGHETETTLELADWHQRELNLNFFVYEALKRTIPPDNSPAFEDFQNHVKIRPFQAMLEEFRPQAYFSGIMHWQTEHRADLPFIKNRGSVLALHPVLDVTQAQVDEFFDDTGWPRNDDYYDPTKGSSQSQECKLNTTDYRYR